MQKIFFTIGIACLFIISTSFQCFALCEGDFDIDFDLDGSDLSIFAANSGDLSIIAADFGRTDCPYSDDFSKDTTGFYDVVHTQTDRGVGQFLYDSIGRQLHILTGDEVALKFSHFLPPLESGVFKVNFDPIVKYPAGGQIWVRLIEDEENYYILSNADGYGAGTISKFVAGQEVYSTALTGEFVQGSNYTITIRFNPGWLSIQAFGENLFAITENQPLSVSRFEIELRQQDAYFDSISYTPVGAVPAKWDDDFSIDTIDSYELAQTLTTGGTGQFIYDLMWRRAEVLTDAGSGLQFSKSMVGLNSGQFDMEFSPLTAHATSGSFFLRLKEDENSYYEIYNSDGLGPGTVKKVVNGQTVELFAFQNRYSQNDNYYILVNFSPGYTKIIAFGEIFTFDTDSSSISVSIFEIELQNQDGYFDNIRFGETLSDYYVAAGDSITRASTHDDISADGTGYQPVLENHLLELKEFPHTVFNAGVSGDTAADGLALLPTTLNAHRQARFYLIQYGTNDAFTPVPSGLGLGPNDDGDYPGTFKDTMQQIIDLVKANGKIPYLAKVPIAFEPRSYINHELQNYNQVVDELIFENKIGVNAPDFYCFFASHPEQMDDDLHPNGLGYQSMADIWHDTLTDQYLGCTP